MVTNSRREAVNLSFGEKMRRMYSMSKKELVLRAIRGETVERDPVGFGSIMWPKKKRIGAEQSSCSRKSIKGHQHYVEEISPDFVKIMSDGFFRYPNVLYSRDHIDPRIKGHSTDWRASSLDWKTDRSGQGDLFHFHEEIASFYNIFSPILTWNAGSVRINPVETKWLQTLSRKIQKL